jgi:hypothetical protein
MGLGNSGWISEQRQRKDEMKRLAVDQGRWKEFVEAPLTS